MLNKVVAGCLISVSLMSFVCAHVQAAEKRNVDFTLHSTVDLLRAPNVNVYGDLSKSALSVAQLLGIDDELGKLDKESKLPAGKRDRLELLILKQSLMEAILSQGFEIRAVLSKVDTEIADADDLQALLEERRDRAVRLNSIANLVSGGITGIVGSGLNLGDINSKADDSIDLSDGIVQSGLAIFALKQQIGEKQISKGLPNMLSRLFEQNNSLEYPDHIWQFLNSVPVVSDESQTAVSIDEVGKTRRQILMDHWRRLGLIDRNRRDKTSEQERVRTIIGVAPKTRVSIDLLEARSAMLHDLRAVVSELDNYLLELVQYLRSVKI